MGFLLGLVLVDLVARLVIVRVVVSLFEKMPSFGVLLGQPQPDVQCLEFPTTHGLTLRGSLYYPKQAAPRGLIVFCPELGGNHWLAMEYGQGLVVAGFAVFAFDFRNQGDSDSMPGYEPAHWPTSFELSDALAAIDFVGAQPDMQALPIGLLGVSRGGVVALAAASRCPSVQSVVCDSSFSTDIMMSFYAQRWASLYVPAWLMRVVPDCHVRGTCVMIRWFSQSKRRVRYVVIERGFRRLKSKPILLVSGSRDSYVPVAVAQQLQKRIGDHCQLWVVPGAKHNRARAIDSEAYDRRLSDFFSRMVNPVKTPQADTTRV
ncbi:MAG: alpha/beta fold hydrolase [Planctomycetaceae bacterium]